MAKNWVLGKHLTTLDLFTGTRNADGSITWNASAATILNHADYIRVSVNRLTELIVGVNATDAHYEGILVDSSLVVGEILRKKSVSDEPVLASIAAEYDYVKVIFVRGGKRYTYYGLIQAFQDGITAMGKNVCEMTLQPVDDGTATAPLAYDTPS